MALVLLANNLLCPQVQKVWVWLTKRSYPFTTTTETDYSIWMTLTLQLNLNYIILHILCSNSVSSFVMLSKILLVMSQIR